MRLKCLRKLVKQYRVLFTLNFKQYNRHFIKHFKHFKICKGKIPTELKFRPE